MPERTWIETLRVATWEAMRRMWQADAKWRPGVAVLSLRFSRYHNPNWDGKPMDPFGDITTRDVTTLRDLLSKYAESTRLLTVKCECVIPDYSNRGHTGLSVEHVHKVAQSMARGFRVRDLDDTEYQGYDIPVLVRETTQTEGGKDALKNWSGIVMETPGFPKPSVQLLRKSKESELFCSLGNGHFFQALNCFRTGVKSIWTQEGFARPDDHLSYVDSYVVPDEHGSNPMLRDAVLNGVPALVLKPDIPLKERVIICELLNKLSDYRWALKAGPSLATDPKDFVVDLDSLKEVDVKQSQFELLSKALDGLELNCLVRQETGQSGGDRVGN
ncbi:unnamed protein product [Amoebophrya sp. A25]|nr:unnamed protein product [Amoebophrya sp. A25]|eukprot:GSA25T00025836001.1